MAVKPIPDGYHTITPYLSAEGADQFIDFLKEAFGAEELMRMPGPDGKIVHAEVRIGDSPLMLTEACDKLPASPSTILLYVDDADAVYHRALKAGAESIEEPSDKFYGDRSAGVQDKFGHRWFVATHIEDVPPDEMQRRAEAYSKQQA